MELLLVLYLTAYIPVKAGEYTDAVTKSRDALLIQSGAKHEFDKARDMVEDSAKKYAHKKGLAAPVAIAGWTIKSARKKEAELKTKWGTLKVNDHSVHYAVSFRF